MKIQTVLNTVLFCLFFHPLLSAFINPDIDVTISLQSYVMFLFCGFLAGYGNILIVKEDMMKQKRKK